MNEKIFKTIRGTGAASLAVGIVVLGTGISAGVMMIVNGARLLKCKSQVLIQFYEEGNKKEGADTGSGAVFSLSAGTDVFSVFCGRIRKIRGRKNVCLQPSALSGNQKILDSPGDAGDVRSILQFGGECDRLHSVWDDPAGHMAENGESFTDPASQLRVQSVRGDDTACLEGGKL